MGRRADQNLRQAERREPPGAREPSARHLQFVRAASSEHSEERKGAQVGAVGGTPTRWAGAEQTRSLRATRRRRSFQKRTVGCGQSLRCPVKALNLARRSALSGSSHQATAPTSARTAASHPSPAPSPEAIVIERRDGAAAVGPRSRKRYELRKRGLETGAEGGGGGGTRRRSRNGGNFAGPRFCDRCSKS